MSPSGDGFVRDALVVLHNLVTLLEHPLGPRPPSDPGTLDALRPEVDTAVASLRHTFVTAPRPLAEWTLDRLVDLDADLLSVTSARVAPPTLAAIVADIAAATELLDVIGRVERRELTEVPLEALARAAYQGPAVFWERTVRLHLDPSAQGVVVRCDPHLGIRLVALAVALVDGDDVVMSARTEPGVLRVRVASGTAQLLCKTQRLRRVPPTRAVAAIVAAAMDTPLVFEESPDGRDSGGAVEVALRAPG
jgi:hypothetical protein